MDSTDNSDLLESFKKLLAENKSYESRLEDYSRIIYSRDNEIQMLQSMLSEANEYRSTIDEQVKELNELKRNLIDIQRQAATSTYMINGHQQRTMETVSPEMQLDNLKQDYAYLQLQLADLQAQILELNNRNLLLTLQSGRVAELESLLADFQRLNEKSGTNENSM
jgi:chromosome segregation ATPase